MKLTRFLKLRRIFGRYEDAVQINPAVLRLLKLCGGMAFAAHLMGCLWFGVSSSDEAATWELFGCGEDDGKHCLAESSLAVQYIASIYWAFATYEVLMSAV